MRETKTISPKDTAKLRLLFWALEEAKLKLQMELESVAKSLGCKYDTEQWTNTSDWTTLIRIK